MGVEAVPTAASQVQAGATQGLVRATPADDAAAVIVPGRGCLRVAEPLGIPRVVGGGSEQGPGGEGAQVPRPEVCLVLLAARQEAGSGGRGGPASPTTSLPGAGHLTCPKHLTSLPSPSRLHNKLKEQGSYSPHFPDGETEAQNREVA